ncbi:archease [Candidatus Woesearchaeota archaeon]|nr:archease [Candidatus Woesearchaeota archaeon]
MKYKYLDHTADTKFRAYGKTLEEAFANAALATTNVMVEPDKIQEKAKKKIAVEGDDLQALLYNFLEQFLILLDAENFFLAAVKKIKIWKVKNNGRISYKLTAEAMGDNAAKYETIGPQVKAVTYNDMVVDEEKDNCFVQAVLDI